MSVRQAVDHKLDLSVKEFGANVGGFRRAMCGLLHDGYTFSALRATPTKGRKESYKE